MTFNRVALKLQDELAQVIKSKKQANEYELIVYKYVFITELEIPVHDEFELEITDDSFSLHLNPDGLKLSLLEELDKAFDRFTITFMPNSYGLLKLNFKLND